MLGVTQETTRLRTRNKVKPKRREVSASCIVLFSVVGFQYFYSLSPDVYCAVGRSSPRTSLISFREAFYFVFWCTCWLPRPLSISLSLLMPPLSEHLQVPKHIRHLIALLRLHWSYQYSPEWYSSLLQLLNNLDSHVKQPCCPASLFIYTKTCLKTEITLEHFSVTPLSCISAACWVRPVPVTGINYFGWAFFCRPIPSYPSHVPRWCMQY